MEAAGPGEAVGEISTHPPWRTELGSFQQRRLSDWGLLAAEHWRKVGSGSFIENVLVTECT